MTRDPVREEKTERAVRAYRGGAWNGYSPYLAAADRGNYPPDNRYMLFGFRAARNSKEE